VDAHRAGDLAVSALCTQVGYETLPVTDVSAIVWDRGGDPTLPNQIPAPG
jgi:hypothetical protein